MECGRKHLRQNFDKNAAKRKGTTIFLMPYRVLRGETQEYVTRPAEFLLPNRLGCLANYDLNIIA